MNDSLKNYAKDELKKGLAQLPEGWQRRFKQMYSFKNMDADINDVVDNMDEEKLDRAMEQVERSLIKIKSAIPGAAGNSSAEDGSPNTRMMQ